MSRPKIEIIRREPYDLPHTSDGKPAERLWLKYKGETYCVVLSHEFYGFTDFRWHISISKTSDIEAGNHDVPIWRDFVAIVHQLRPGIQFAIPVPPENQWMNECPNVLHVHEIRDDHLIRKIQRTGSAVRGTKSAVPT